MSTSNCLVNLQVAEEILTLAYESGINVFDTAEVYAAGKWVNLYRDINRISERNQNGQSYPRLFAICQPGSGQASTLYKTLNQGY